MTQFMKIHKNCHFILFLLTYLFFHSSQNQDFKQANNYEGSSNLVKVEYHMGPVLASKTINIYIIWYGHWYPNHQSTIKDFLYSLSTPAPFPSVADWWSTVRLYTDQTGANISGNLVLSGEHFNTSYSHGKYLTRLTIQSIIKSSITPSSLNPKPLPLNYQNGVYLVLSSWDVQVQDFCREVCGFHYFTFPNIVGVTVPYAWVGYSGAQCPGFCAYPFAWPKYSPRPPPGVGSIIGSPNGDAATDGMISVLAHELAEMSSNPLVNAWYAGDDPSTPSEIADLCVGVYGSGGGGGYVGKVYKDSRGNGFNLNGVNGRKFLLQWVWNPVKKRCFGPNAID